VSDPKRPKHGHLVVTNNQEPVEFETTLNTKTTIHDDGFEDKRWSIVLEEVTKTGQRKPLAQAKINLADLVGENADEKVFKEIQNLELRGYKDRVQDVKLSLHLAGVLLKTGEATDEDLQSLASMLSTNTLDIGNLDDFSDSMSEHSSSGINAEGLLEINTLTAQINSMTGTLGNPFHTGSVHSFETDYSDRSGDRSTDKFGDTARLSRTLPRNFETKDQLQVHSFEAKPKTPPSSRKLRPSQMEFKKEEPEDDPEDETVGGTAQELLTWVRQQTQYSAMVNVTNLTSSFRSGVTFGVILHNFRPEALKLGQLNPRTAKANLKIVLEAYKNEGLDLYGIININEMASKPDKLAVITALHKIRLKFSSEGGENPSVRLRQKKTSKGIDRSSIHSVLFDSKSTWTSIAEFKVETLLEEIRKWF